MKKVEKINLIVHAYFFLEFIVSITLLWVYRFPSVSSSFIIFLQILSMLQRMLCFCPIIFLCVLTVIKKISCKCNVWISLYPCLLCLLYVVCFLTQGGLFVVTTGGV